ncbi:MAG: hypothetical protein ABIE74_04930 [Pseudomonadota bacterium]
MTKGGKKLFMIAGIAMVSIFVALLILSEMMAPKEKGFKKVSGSQNVSQWQMNVEEQKSVSSFKRPLPSVTLSRTLQDIAYARYLSNRIHDAIRIWEISLYLNESNYLSKRRQEEAKGHLDQIVNEMVALGNMDYKNLRYQRAIKNWEKVLNLVGDSNGKIYKETLDKITLARKKLRQ